ncbi:MAG: carboxypeptidase-like regulatory domain-containing protein [Muribaculaceae bacterium]|nr:carboxypeptidase-like regulatory domain-containing protein [Muribaculaceae bacterium]
MRYLLLLLWIVIGVSLCNGKSIVELRDSITGEKLPLATIRTLEGKKRTFITDEKGQTTLPENLRHSGLVSSYIGYSDKYFTIGETDSIVIVRLSPTEYDLEEVYIKPKKEKYSKKNNPAVDFVNRLRESSEKSNPEKEPFYSYEKYEKTLLAINNFNGRFDSGFLAGKIRFLENYVDTSSYTGARLLDLMLKEKYAVHIKSQEPKADREIILGYRSEGVDDAFGQENIRVVLEDVIREVDVYDANINILQNRFVSPLSPLGPDFYKYYLTDTVYIGNERCVELTFVPRNAQSMGFNGKIYVPEGDTSMFVKKITMRTPHDINLNFLRNLYINQSFSKDSLGNRLKTYDDVCIEMQIVAGTPEFYGRKTTVYDNFSYNPREDFISYYKKGGKEVWLQDSIGNTAQFWNEKRMVPMTTAEARMGNIATEMRKVPLLYWAEKVIKMMESGYFTTGNPSKFDIGPLNTFLSYNSVEGVRIRLGGMTMAALNPHLFLKGYGAYGTKDGKWKYGATLEYSFHRKPKHGYEWPRHGFYASYSYDLDLIGQHYLFTNQDNIFLSLKRKKSDLVTYRKHAEAGYVLELPNNFSVEAGGQFNVQEATRWLPFIYSDGRAINSYRQSSFNISLRWAKGEKFVQGRSTRLLVNMDPWIIQLTHRYGPKGLFGAAYTTNETELSVQKRFWFSAFGYIDIIAKAGKVWSSVYYPGLMWPNANLSYTIQPESYSLMDPMEFANDMYASIDFTYFGNGVLFNRIPYINKLKLREAITFKGLMGTLSDRNNPALNPSLLAFPADSHAIKMGKTPYMEIGAGIDNILSVLRVDYVWRLTYRGTPGVDRGGLRISLHFTL